MTGLAFAIALTIASALGWDAWRRYLLYRGEGPDEQRIKRIERELEQLRMTVGIGARKR